MSGLVLILYFQSLLPTYVTFSMMDGEVERESQENGSRGENGDQTDSIAKTESNTSMKQAQKEKIKTKGT